VTRLTIGRGGKLLRTSLGIVDFLVTECPPCYRCPDQFDISFSAGWQSNGFNDCPDDECGDLEAFGVRVSRFRQCTYTSATHLTEWSCVFGSVRVALAFAWRAERDYDLLVEVLRGSFGLVGSFRINSPGMNCANIAGLLVPPYINGICNGSNVSCTISAV